MNRIVPGLFGPHNGMKTILVLTRSWFHMLSAVVQVHQNPTQKLAACSVRRFRGGELPVLEQKLRLISATRRLFGLLDLTQPLRSVSSLVLHHHHETVTASDPVTHWPSSSRPRGSETALVFTTGSSTLYRRWEKDCMEPCYCNNNLYSM